MPSRPGRTYFSLITEIVGRRSSRPCVLLAAEVVALQLLLRVA